MGPAGPASELAEILVIGSPARSMDLACPHGRLPAHAAQVKRRRGRERPLVMARTRFVADAVVGAAPVSQWAGEVGQWRIQASKAGFFCSSERIMSSKVAM